MTQTLCACTVVASEKGVVVGRLTFREDGDLIDCSKARSLSCVSMEIIASTDLLRMSRCQMGIGGKAIPPNVDKVEDMRSDAQFILLVEKDAAFMRLAEDRFYNKYPCIIITGKGQPDVATRCVTLSVFALLSISLAATIRRFPSMRSLFLKKAKTELRIPVLGLVDSDPSGLKARNK